MTAFIMVTKVSTDRRGSETNGSHPAAINVDAIRTFYARHNNRPGTRITFTDGGGFAVSDTPQEIASQIAAQTGSTIVFPEPPAREPLTGAAPVGTVSPADEENDDVA